MYYKKFRTMVQDWQDDVYGDGCTKQKLFIDHGIRFSYIRNVNQYRFEGSGNTQSLAQQSLNSFVASLQHDLGVILSAVSDVEFKTDKRKKLEVASCMYVVNDHTDNIDDPQNHTLILRNYNKRDLGDIYRLEFNETDLAQFETIVTDADGSGGYELLIEMGQKIILKKYGSKKYALSHFPQHETNPHPYFTKKSKKGE